MSDKEISNVLASFYAALALNDNGISFLSVDNKWLSTNDSRYYPNFSAVLENYRVNPPQSILSEIKHCDNCYKDYSEMDMGCAYCELNPKERTDKFRISSNKLSPAEQCCKSIYLDINSDEIICFTKAIQRAWNIGKRL